MNKKCDFIIPAELLPEPLVFRGKFDNLNDMKNPKAGDLVLHNNKIYAYFIGQFILTDINISKMKYMKG